MYSLTFMCVARITISTCIVVHIAQRNMVQVTTVLAQGSMQEADFDPKVVKAAAKCVRDTSAAVDRLKALLDTQMQEFNHLVRYLKGVKTSTTVRTSQIDKC